MQQSGQMRQRHAPRDSHRHPADGSKALLSDLPQGSIENVVQILGFPQQHGSRLCQHQPAGGAVEDFEAQTGFNGL
ncbi:MAG: hypothetical protein EOP86_28395, partial [Verrucomicrobiaceae bacterium]